MNVINSALGPSLAPVIRSSKTLSRWVKPFANWYADASGYRKIGLRYDDLIAEERQDVERAVARLTPREQYDRAFRFKRASQASVLHAPLPKEQWTTPSQDIRYLTPHIEDIQAEQAERSNWDNMAVQRK